MLIVPAIRSVMLFREKAHSTRLIKSRFEDVRQSTDDINKMKNADAQIFINYRRKGERGGR